MLTNRSFFDLDNVAHRELFPDDHPVWEPLKSLKAYMDGYAYPPLPAGLVTGAPLAVTCVLHEGVLLSGEGIAIEFGDATKGKLKVRQEGQALDGASVVMAGAVLMDNRIALGQGVLVETGAMIKGPAIIGDRTEIRQGAYLRGYCLVGRRCVVGHVTEAKHSILLDDAKAGHFAYLGDSILGNGVNLGAGTKLANLRFTPGDVPAKTPNGLVSTGLKKLGAILADHVQTGCNSVTNPGTFLGRKSVLMPNTTAPSGFHAASSLIR